MMSKIEELKAERAKFSDRRDELVAAREICQSGRRKLLQTAAFGDLLAEKALNKITIERNDLDEKIAVLTERLTLIDESLGQALGEEISATNADRARRIIALSQKRSALIADYVKAQKEANKTAQAFFAAGREIRRIAERMQPVVISPGCVVSAGPHAHAIIGEDLDVIAELLTSSVPPELIRPLRDAQPSMNDRAEIELRTWAAFTKGALAYPVPGAEAKAGACDD